jgi:ubiquinone/menaquinone biosynthesis C-methylase UbiE
MSSPATDAHFARVASTYDELRPADERWWALFDEIVAAGDLRGRRLLDLGCGTGKLSAALAEKAVARVWGVDASEEMAAVARAAGVNVKVAPAERLPFKDGWFERVVSRMAVHLLDRPRAFGELRRVLAPDGLGVIVSMDPAWFREHWLLPWFPRLIEIDLERFPAGDVLAADLRATGFDVELRRFDQPAEITREDALARIRGRAFSTFELLRDAEYRAGLAQAEAEFPGRRTYTVSWLLAVIRPSAAPATVAPGTTL